MGFRYLAVMISMVLGFGLTTLCGGIGNLVQIRRRVKLYWLHSLWVVLLLVLHVHLWWAFWSLRGVADWTYAGFLFVLIGPGALVIASHIIIPELLAERIDVEKYYFDTSPLFFGILTVGAVWFMLLEPIIASQPLLVPVRFLQAVAVVALGCCSASKDRRVHVTAIGVIVAALVTAIVLVRFSLAQFGLR